MTWFRRSVHPEDDLSAYVDGELGERARRAVETHLASCEACSTLFRELQDTKSLLSELPSVQLRRSLALGPEFAVERRVALAPRRLSLAFAPAVALTVLVGLLFVDAIDSSGGSNNDGSSTTAASQQAPEAAAGLAIESSKAATAENPTLGAAAAPAATVGEASGGALSSAAAAPSQDSFADTEETPAPLAREAGSSGNDAAANSTAGEPQQTSQVADSDDSSSGLSTLRILEIAAAIAFAASLLAVFLPRIVEDRKGNSTR
jgi:anti-sigma factor RsiW